MSTDRLFMTSPAIDGRDDIEDYWLKNRDYVLSIPQVQTYHMLHMITESLRNYYVIDYDVQNDYVIFS